MNHPPSARRWLHRLRPLLRGHPATLVRRALAAALFVLAVALAARPAAAGGESGGPLLVTARDLPLGSTLRPADVRTAHVPDSLRPDGALTDPAQVNGKQLMGVARSGEPLTDARLIGERSAPPGTATVPVRLADSGVAGLLQPGTRVDVVTVGAAEQAEKVLASNATVLTVAGEQAWQRDGPLGSDEAPLVLLAAPEDVAAHLAAVSLGQPVTVTLR
ncbi:RcpC/CpaB family pilus assembly protein [Prauserella cavernicola]|uniref:Flagellar biosynthesis protein FlgA n=1 Tax=Prauserella cavernicola TaxID=2800127 RepID=A0A934QTS6_9PSEU|nr:RcpC/CpaB family pilus assembly protein [Prauserella cavernicola]MBK1785494.1 flagellar biosynthesis protein FlgA [Prauserella cavernicola]